MGLRLVVSTTCGLGIFAWQAGVAHAATLNVTSEADDGTPGTLRAVITSASTGANTIAFSAGVAHIVLNSPLPTVDFPLTMRGPGAEKLTIESAAADSPVLALGGNAKVSTIIGVTIQGGSNASGNGGGISVALGGSLTVQDSVITGNTAQLGGGIYTEGTLLVRNCTISDNTGTGAIYAAAGLTIIDSAITGTQGTAIVFNPAADNSLSIARSTVSGNAGGANEIGGLQLQAGNASLSNTTFSGNTGGMGGDFWMFSSGVTLDLLNVTAAASSSPSLRFDMAGTVTLRNTLLAGTGDRCLGAPTSLGHNLSTDTSCNLTDPTDLAGMDPKLAPLADNGGPTQTHALLIGSPAANAADAMGLDGDVDQRGYARVQFGAPDIGALEVTEPMIMQQPTAQHVTVGHAFTLTIVAANQNSGRPLGYQWRKEATAIAGAVQSTYNKSAELTDAGNYDVLVTNDGGTLTSMSVAVAIDPAPPTAEPPSSGGGCCSVSGGDWSTGALGLLVAGLLGSPRRRRRGQ